MRGEGDAGREEDEGGEMLENDDEMEEEEEEWKRINRMKRSERTRWIGRRKRTRRRTR